MDLLSQIHINLQCIFTTNIFIFRIFINNAQVPTPNPHKLFLIPNLGIEIILHFSAITNVLRESHLSFLKFVPVRLGFVQFALSTVTVFTEYVEEDIGISACSFDVPCFDIHCVLLVCEWTYILIYQ